MQEQLFKVNMVSRSTDFTLFLLVLGTDSMDVMGRLDAVIGPAAEYKLQGIRPVRRQGRIVSRGEAEEMGQA